MSQVIRKYNSGGQTDKPKLLSIKGLGDFNQDDLIKRGYRDVDEYTSSKGLKNAAAADFRNAVPLGLVPLQQVHHPQQVLLLLVLRLLVQHQVEVQHHLAGIF
jgi:hypothetical protein